MVQLSDCVNNFEFEKAYMQKIQEQDCMCTCVCIVAVSTLVLALIKKKNSCFGLKKNQIDDVHNIFRLNEY